MRASRVFLIASALILPFAAGACSRTTTEPPAPPAPAGRSAEDIEALYRARIDSMRSRYTEADVAFMSGMIHHHAQAIEMSRLAPTHTDNASLQIMAARIINAQQDEIATMQRWLRDRDQAVPEVHISDAGVMVHGADHSMHMPGMLTPDQMAELRAARGTAFERLFLAYMIQHHQGAVTMVRDLFATDRAGQDEEAFRLAADIQADQSSEIARMEQMLSSLPDDEGSR